MKIDYCLILAAGFGTRMGTIGTSLPKVLWPIFDKNLLHLQILYAKKIGVEKIYINLHHQSAQIKDFVDSLQDPQIKLLLETPEILDIGGGIHNLAAQKEVQYQGNLLLLNSDQFLLFSSEYLNQGLKLIELNGTCLFGIKVSKAGKYNQTQIDAGGFLQKIILENEVKDEQFWTYSGVSLVNLTKLKKCSGASKFFDTVAPYKSQPIPFIKLEKISYWDFGTLDRYYQSMFSILKSYKNKDSDFFIDFLLESRAFNPSLVNHNSYRSKCLGVIDLDNGNSEVGAGSIILKQPDSVLPLNKKLVVYGDCTVVIPA